MISPIIDAQGVSMRLGHGPGQVEALRNVDLPLYGGQLTLLMGPSGSGKTTLLSILGCMLKPTAGTVAICGYDTTGARPEQMARLRRDHIGFVFQSFHLLPTLSALDNVRIALDIRGDHSAHATEKARAMLDAVGLSHRTSSYPHELSGGEQQRVAIARAIVADPAALLADEPTAALDGESGHGVMTILARIARDASHAVLVVTHDSRIVSFADRIVHIEDGCIIADESSVDRELRPALATARYA
jgi:putative ABC transport system ATP-binding protein